MKKRTHKKLKFLFWSVTVFTLYLCMLFVPGYEPLQSTGENYFHIYVNDTLVGNLADPAPAEHLLIEARRSVAREKAGMLFLTASLRIEGEEVLFGDVDRPEAVSEAMKAVLRGCGREKLEPSYTVKLGDYMANLSSQEEVRELLQAAITRYDPSGTFRVELVQDPLRTFTVLTARVTGEEEQDGEEPSPASSCGGVATELANFEAVEETPESELPFEAFRLGVTEVNFTKEVEIAEGYLPASQIILLSDAVEEVTKEEEKPSEYKIVSGDTLSEIAMKLSTPIDTLIALNPDKLADANAILHIDDILIYTVPEPEVAVQRVERCYYEEVYDAPVVYIPRDDWYTTETNLIQQPSAGFRKVVVDEFYVNDVLSDRVIVREEVVMEAVPKIVERGTKVPPTYIKPISGGRLSSGFGYRSRPTRGASTYHKGIDWATPVGTSVYASSGGTVSKAGWGSGYGYVVYIDHPDGKQTRYGHLSKVLVTVGQSVSQGQLIAKSGNTGVSTGPHIHFEILVGGKQVNPLNYISQ
ncbi:MAG: M23 family metallopeptidase [Lachnospiraceae bacterium]|nr:M23 family metallopeptidase [Lachnospiraceae bacterium]